MIRYWNELVEWVLPARPYERDDPLAAEVARRLMERACHLLVVVTLLTPPFVLGFAALLWGPSDPTKIVVWGGLVCVTSANCGGAARRIFIQTVVPENPPHSLSLTMAASGLAWGSIPIVAMPDTAAWQAFTGTLVFGPLAANVLFSASVPRLFWPFHLGLITSATAGYLESAGETRFAILIVLAYTIPFGIVMSAIKLRTDQQGAYYTLTNEAMVEELSIKNTQLAIEASQDALTGLSNRTEFSARLSEALFDHEGQAGYVGLLFIDLDHFKVVNDSLGHVAGDELLIDVAQRIDATIRPDDLLGRLGGDEFTILATGVEGIDQLQALAQRVLGSFDEPFALDGRLHPMSASIGVALADSDARTATDLLRLADAALYQAKSAGRSRVSVFDASMRDRLDRRLDDETELRTALRDGQLTGWFQPIVNLSTGAIEGAEGLARWQHESGTRDAGAFIELASEVGLDLAISKAVWNDLQSLEHGLRATGTSIELGFNLPPVHLFELLDLFDVQDDLSGFTIEITETGVISDVRRAAARLSEMQARGASIWLDDFGQGQSSMSLLTELPLDGVKIDRHFVTDVVHDRTSRTIVGAITDIGRNLGYQVIAEGVETLEQAETLRSIGVTHGQGYLFSPALPPRDFLALHRQGFSYAEQLRQAMRPTLPSGR